ncbi:MAG: orotate phosphoribosyltransferase, partial [Pseudomonadales bacterium]
MQAYQQAFIDLALQHEVLKFGSFKLKSGRISPYFFNAGLFKSGASLATVGEGYAQAITEAGLEFNMLLGPAYKGIPLATAAAIGFHHLYRRDVPFAYNRKETKTHGEGGQLVGAPLQGRVLVIDDVITAGTAIREAIALIHA